MGMNRFGARGLGQMTREFLTVADNSTLKVTADQAQAEILIPGTSTITNNVPGGVTVNAGNSVIQMPNVAGDLSDGQYWWFDLSAITISANAVKITGTLANGNATTGVTVSSIPTNKGVLVYWNGSDMVRIA